MADQQKAKEQRASQMTSPVSSSSELEIDEMVAMLPVGGKPIASSNEADDVIIIDVDDDSAAEDNAATEAKAEDDAGCTKGKAEVVKDAAVEAVLDARDIIAEASSGGEHSKFYEDRIIVKKHISNETLKSRRALFNGRKRKMSTVARKNPSKLLKQIQGDTYQIFRFYRGRETQRVRLPIDGEETPESSDVDAKEGNAKLRKLYVSDANNSDEEEEKRRSKFHPKDEGSPPSAATVRGRYAKYLLEKQIDRDVLPLPIFFRGNRANVPSFVVSALSSNFRKHFLGPEDGSEAPNAVEAEALRRHDPVVRGDNIQAGNKNQEENVKTGDTIGDGAKVDAPNDANEESDVPKPVYDDRYMDLLTYWKSLSEPSSETTTSTTTKPTQTITKPTTDTETKTKDVDIIEYINNYNASIRAFLSFDETSAIIAQPKEPNQNDNNKETPQTSEETPKETEEKNIDVAADLSSLTFKGEKFNCNKKSEAAAGKIDCDDLPIDLSCKKSTTSSNSDIEISSSSQASDQLVADMRSSQMEVAHYSPEEPIEALGIGEAEDNAANKQQLPTEEETAPPQPETPSKEN